MIEQFIQQVVELTHTLPAFSIYLVFFSIAYIENILPPIPGDVLVAFGGYLAAEEIIGLVPVYLLTTFASVIGFMSMYAIGSHWGMQIKEKQQEHWLIRLTDIRYVEKVQSWMSRWGQGVILANRFLAGTRSVISLTAGISHTSVNKTILSSTVSSLLWNAILLGSGWIVQKNWRVIGEYLAVYSRIILIGIAVFIVIRLIMHYYPRFVNSS